MIKIKRTLVAHNLIGDRGGRQAQGNLGFAKSFRIVVKGHQNVYGTPNLTLAAIDGRVTPDDLPNFAI